MKINLKVFRDIEMNNFNQKLASLEIARAAFIDGNHFEATATEMCVINGQVQVQILERPNKLSAISVSQNASGAP